MDPQTKNPELRDDGEEKAELGVEASPNSDEEKVGIPSLLVNGQDMDDKEASLPPGILKSGTSYEAALNNVELIEDKRTKKK